MMQSHTDLHNNNIYLCVPATSNNSEAETQPTPCAPSHCLVTMVEGLYLVSYAIQVVNNLSV